LDTTKFEMEPEEVLGTLEDGSLTLLDIRRIEEREIVRLEDDLWIPMRKVPHRLDELSGCNRPIVVYCHRGIRSLKVARILRQEGINDSYSLAGGIDLWAKSIDPDMPTY